LIKVIAVQIQENPSDGMVLSRAGKLEKEFMFTYLSIKMLRENPRF
jgi:hypothetical protein